MTNPITNLLKYLVTLTLFSGLMACSQESPKGDSDRVSSKYAAFVTAPTTLETEMQVNPIGVERTNPRLSWRSEIDNQLAYEIEVATRIEKLTQGAPDLWSTGRVDDERSVAIPYRGTAMSSRDTAFWRVRVWAEGNDKPGPWSEAASWKMGLLEQSDWRAKWITSPSTTPAETIEGLERWYLATAADPLFTDKDKISKAVTSLRNTPPAGYFRKDFVIEKPVSSARLYSTSAGYSEFFLSGEKIGDRIFNPAQTDFDKRIYYDVDDVAEKLTTGSHRLAVHLGNGFYGERTAFGRDDLFYGEPAAIAQLEINYEDGTRDVIVSDESWQYHASPILKNGVYSGEVYDARKEVKGWAEPDQNPNQNIGVDWQSAKAVETAPTMRLVSAEMPPVRRVKEVAPQLILNPSPGIWTIDFGQNFTGVPTIDFAKLDLEEGQTVLLRYAEWADYNGTVSMKSGGRAPRTKQVDAYISDGRDEDLWSPKFTWHGFRYMEISGINDMPPIGAFTAHLTRTDIPIIGQFESSNALLNRIHDTALWSFEANLVSVPSDCPIRERNGWTGDAHATVRMASYNYDMSPFLEKYLGDFKTTEKIAPTIVPGRRTNSGKIDWAAAEVILTWEHYLHSGDRSVIERQYDSLLEYVGYVEGVAEGDLFTNEKHFYGDWCDTLPELGMARPLGRCRAYSTPAEITTTALIFRVYDLMSEMATRVGKDASHYMARRDTIGQAFHSAYFNEASGDYGSQTANAMALSFGIAPEYLREGVAAALDLDVRETWDGHASAGALGQTWLYPSLSDYGYTDTAYGVFMAEGPPGYSYLFETLNGTTIWEDITKFVPSEGKAPGKSLNHPFHGGYDAWFYSGLGGIIPDARHPGYKHFYLRPVFPKDLETANISLETPYGLIQSEWERSAEAIEWRVTVPSNSSATVKLGQEPHSVRVIGPGKHRLVLSANGEREVSHKR